MRPADDLPGQDFLHAVGQFVERDFVGDVVELRDVPRAGQFLPHLEPLRPRAFGRVDAGERHAAENERVDG